MVNAVNVLQVLFPFPFFFDRENEKSFTLLSEQFKFKFTSQTFFLFIPFHIRTITFFQFQSHHSAESLLHHYMTLNTHVNLLLHPIFKMDVEVSIKQSAIEPFSRN